jgi:hypothetical protein
MFLHQPLPHLLAPIAIQNVMPAQKSRGMTSGRIQHMLKMSGPVLTNVYQVFCGSQSFTLKHHLFKLNNKLSFDVSRQMVSGCSMIGPVVNLPLAAPPRGAGLQRTSTPKHIAT